MKKTVAILFVLLLLLTLCACSNVPDDLSSALGFAPSQDKDDTYFSAQSKDAVASSIEEETSKSASAPPESHAAEVSDRTPAANSESSKKTSSAHSGGTNAQSPSRTSETASASKSESAAGQTPSGKLPVKETLSVRRSPIYGSAGFPAMA